MLLRFPLAVDTFFVLFCYFCLFILLFIFLSFAVGFIVAFFLAFSFHLFVVFLILMVHFSHIWAFTLPFSPNEHITHRFLL